MIWLSEILIQEHGLASFADLTATVGHRAQSGEIHFGIDVKPPFPDTPDNWEDLLELAFADAGRR